MPFEVVSPARALKRNCTNLARQPSIMYTSVVTFATCLRPTSRLPMVGPPQTSYCWSFGR